MALRGVRPIIVLAMLLGGLGCTHVSKIDAPAPPTAGAKHPLIVSLVLDDAFCQYTYSKNRLGDTFVYPFGPALCDYAEQAARAAFERVDVYERGRQVDQGRSAGGVLRAKVSRFNEVFPGWATQHRELLLVVEWTLTASDGKLVWLSSVEASSSEPAGTAFSFKDNERRLFGGLLSDLRDKTVKAFRVSPEIRRLVPDR